MNRDQQLAVWTARIGPKPARAIVRANRVSAWALLLPVGFLLEFIGYHAGSDRIQQVGFPFFLIGGLGLVIGGSLRRRAARQVRVALNIASDDNRMAPTELPPLDEVAYRSWVRWMTTDPQQAEPEPAFAEAPLWSTLAPEEPILSHSCMRCVFRPKPHRGCGHKDCACARSGHCGWLGPRPKRLSVDV